MAFIEASTGRRADVVIGKPHGEIVRAAQERLGLAVDPDVPLIGMVTRLVSHKGLDLVKGGVDNIMTYSNAQFVVLGSGDWEYEQFFKEMQAKYPGRFVLCQALCRSLRARSTAAPIFS